MDRQIRGWSVAAGMALLMATGCMSPYHADRGALAGGLTGAGAGALIGSATGNAGAGAAIGAGLGTLTGAMIGSEMDQIEARNRAMIAQQLGRQVPVGAVTMNDVISMTQGGVSEELVVSHIEHNGMAAPLQPNDLIFLKQQGISDRVVKAMQTPPKRVAATSQPVVVAQPVPQPVIVQEYWDPWGPHYYYGRPWCHRPPPPHVSWGVAIRN